MLSKSTKLSGVVMIALSLFMVWSLYASLNHSDDSYQIYIGEHPTRLGGTPIVKNPVIAPVVNKPVLYFNHVKWLATTVQKKAGERMMWLREQEKGTRLYGANNHGAAAFVETEVNQDGTYIEWKEISNEEKIAPFSIGGVEIPQSKIGFSSDLVTVFESNPVVAAGEVYEYVQVWPVDQNIELKVFDYQNGTKIFSPEKINRGWSDEKINDRKMWAWKVGIIYSLVVLVFFVIGLLGLIVGDKVKDGDTSSFRSMAIAINVGVAGFVLSVCLLILVVYIAASILGLFFAGNIVNPFEVFDFFVLRY